MALAKPSARTRTRWTKQLAAVSKLVNTDTNDAVDTERRSLSRRRSFWVVMTLILLSAVVWLATVVLDRNKPNPLEVYRAGMAALDQGDLERVDAAINQLEGEVRFEEHRCLLRARLMLRGGNYVSALDQLTRLNYEGKLRKPALLLTGEALYWLQRLAEAEKIFRQVLSEHPDSVRAHRWLGAIHYDLGAYDLAVVHLQKLAELQPDDFSPHRLIGLMAHDFEDEKNAIEHYRKALDRKPPIGVREEIVHELAEAHINQREYDAAVEILNQSGGGDVVKALLAECYWGMGEHDRARKLLERAARGPEGNDRRILLLQARISLESNDAEAAIAILKRALQVDAHDAECRYQIALAYRKLGRNDESEVHMKLRSESQALKERLTELNLQANREPRNAGIREELAEVCEKLGKHKLAQMWRQAAEAGRQANEIQKAQGFRLGR